MAFCRDYKKNQILKYILNKETPEEAFEPDTEEQALLELIARKVKSGYYGANVSDALIEQFITEYLTEHPIEAVEIANNLTTATTGKALDATQGKALKDLLDALSERIDNLPAGGGTGSDVDLSEYAKKTDLHSHSNKGVLDKLSDNNGTLQYNGSDITGGSGSTADVPVATTSTAGKVKPDGTTITVTSDGTISAVTADSATITTAVNAYMTEHPVSSDVGDGSVTEVKLASDVKDSLYTIDFTGTTTEKDYTYTGNENAIGSDYICSVHPKFTEDVALTDFTIKGMGSTATIELWEISDSGAKFLRLIDTITFGSVIQSVILTYTFKTPLIVRSNQMVFIRTSNNRTGAQIATLSSVNSIFNTEDIWGVIKTSDITNNSASYWHISTLHGFYSKYHYYTLSDGYTYANSLKEEVAKCSSLVDVLGKKPYTTVYNKDLKEISTEFVNQDNAWSVNSTGDGVTTTTTNKYLRLEKTYYSDKRYIEVRFSGKSDTILKIATTGLGGNAFYVDIANNKAYVNMGWNNLFENNLSKFTLTADKDYVVRFGLNCEHRWYGITEYSTGITEYFVDETMNRSNWTSFNGKYTFTLHSGSEITIKNVNVNIINNPTVYLTGDSITAGSSMSNPNERYGTLIRKNDIPDLVISAEGGIKVVDLLNLFENEIKYIKPKFVVATYGANNSLDELKNSSYGYTPVITKFEEAGIPLYINSITCNSTYNSGTSTYSAYNKHSEKNEYIRSLGKKGARLDLATAVDNIPDTTEENDDRCNHDLYADTYLHPNEAGNKAIYERIKADLPELFM